MTDMKAFNEWFAKNQPAATTFVYMRCKQTWRAALKWVESHPSIPSTHDPLGIIEEELEDD